MAISNISGFALLDAIVTALHPTSGTTTIGALTITFPIKIRLMTAAGNSTTAGTELTSGGSYVAGTGISTSTDWAATSGGSQATNAVLSQTNMPAATITAIELWDSNGTPKRIEYGNLSASKTTASGDTLSFASGAITSAIA
jgi:hypothetical protein